jgi:hypothetical protein
VMWFLKYDFMFFFFFYSSSPCGHQVRPISDLFRPDNCIRPVVSLMVIHDFSW